MFLQYKLTKRHIISTKNIILSTVILYLIFTFIFSGFEYLTKKNFESKNSDPTASIFKIEGTQNENIIITPNKEFPFRQTTFTPAPAGGVLELRAPNYVPEIIHTEGRVPIYYEKWNQNISYFAFESPLRRKVSFYYNGELKNDESFLDAHDAVVHTDGTFTFLYYEPDYRTGLLHMRIKRLDKNNRVLFDWSSQAHISQHDSLYTSVSEDTSLKYDESKSIYKILLKVREKYSRLILDLIGPENYRQVITYKLPLANQPINLFDNQIHMGGSKIADIIHANSIEYLNNDQNILISARHLDSIFIIDVTSGKIVWALGGKKSRFTTNRVIGDPRGGFSHQHDARIYKNKLYIYDNGNMEPNVPSRAVVYTFDLKDAGRSRFLYEYLEPEGRRRLTMGSIQPLNNNRILIGWGGVPLGPDRDEPTLAASIVNMKTEKSEWQMWLNPGWTSYRVRAY